MSATIINLHTRRPLAPQSSAPWPTYTTDDTTRRAYMIGRVLGMPEPDCRMLSAHALRRLKEGQTHAEVIAWARGFVRDFMRHWPGPGAA